MIKLQLPFNGAWLTFWGGDTLEQNHHHEVTSQKYAFDFIKINKAGTFFRTDGETCEDYFSFGEDILAPASGIIVEAVDGLRDNKPRQINSFNYLGNYIMIKHAENVYSVLGHLRQDSVVVTKGYKVDVGQKLATCGNSGYTTDPHLHFHVQDSDVFAKVDKRYNKVNAAQGQKVAFENIRVANDKAERVEKIYSPVKNDIVSNE
ncbi:MAG: M23 family metallopeptidase [Candidatus Saccharimonadales bacterium]